MSISKGLDSCTVFLIHMTVRQYFSQRCKLCCNLCCLSLSSTIFNVTYQMLLNVLLMTKHLRFYCKTLIKIDLELYSRSSTRRVSLFIKLYPQTATCEVTVTSQILLSNFICSIRLDAVILNRETYRVELR